MDDQDDSALSSLQICSLCEEKCIVSILLILYTIVSIVHVVNWSLFYY